MTSRSADKCERCGRFASTIAPTYGPVSQGSEPSPYYWCAPCREEVRRG